MAHHIWNETLDYQMMQDVALADGIAGNEKEVSRVLKRYVADSVDEISYDHLGSIAFKKQGHSEDMLFDSYLKKHQKNHVRQDEHY